MAEEIVWRGRSSQWMNFGRYALCALMVILIVAIGVVAGGIHSPGFDKASPFILLLSVVPLSMAVARYLQTKSKTYELTTERVKISQGVFSKVTDTLELYRVKDIETHQPFLYRLVGLENVRLNTSDTSSPFVLIGAIPAGVALADKIRNQVEIIRTQKGVREIDME
jgi:uncharacterized membrane protein YdbT with pleckstrin-like domain